MLSIDGRQVKLVEARLERAVCLPSTPEMTRALPPMVWSARGSGY
ncbi:MAG: hypothetical protein ABIN08_15070 [Caldimonas sp.]